MKNKILFWSFILAFGLGLIFWSSFRWNNRGSEANRSFPTLTPTPLNNNSRKPAKDLQSLTPQEVEKMLNNTNGLAVPTSVPYSQLNKPAFCRTEGVIKFLSPTVYENDGAKLVYSGIDSPARQIKWKISPLDSLTIGPNLAASLKLPDGETPIGATLPSNPQSKNYELFGSMTYGRIVGEGVKVYEMDCSGEVKVIISY